MAASSPASRRKASRRSSRSPILPNRCHPIRPIETEVDVVAEILGSGVAIGVAMGRYDFARRRRNALWCSAVAAAVSLVANLIEGDYLRLAIFVPTFFALTGGGAYLGYLLHHR